MKFRWEYIAAALGLALAAGLALSNVGVGTYGTWDEDATAESALAEMVDAAPGAKPPMGMPRITADELAASILAGEPGLTIVDVRDADVAPTDCIAGAYWLPLDEDAWAAPGPFPEHRRLVLVAEDDGAAEAAWHRAARLGYQDVTLLAGGQPAWNTRYLDPQEPAEGAAAEVWTDYRERNAVALYLAGGVDALTAGSASAAPARPAVAPPPLPVRQGSAGPKAAEGC